MEELIKKIIKNEIIDLDPLLYYIYFDENNSGSKSQSQLYSLSKSQSQMYSLSESLFKPSLSKSLLLPKFSYEKIKLSKSMTPIPKYNLSS